MSDTKPTSPTRINRLILTMAFSSGFTIMSIELLGGRILAPYFGSSIYVWGSIITVFMLSLSIGYLMGGRWSLYQPSFQKYGILFVVSGLLMLPIIGFSEPFMDWVFDRVEDPRYGSLLASVLLFFLPTTVMGMIAPYSVRLLVDSSERSGQVAGLLYFVSTLGSALGTLATSFYLVLYFEVNQIIGFLMALMVLLGVMALSGLIKGQHHE